MTFVILTDMRLIVTLTLLALGVLQFNNVLHEEKYNV